MISNKTKVKKIKINQDAIVEKIFTKLDYQIPLQDLKSLTSIIFESISDLLPHSRIEIRGFGTFSVRSRLVPLDPRYNNKQGGKKILCKSVYFRMSKKMSDRLDLL